jgi:hypothetical protein
LHHSHRLDGLIVRRPDAVIDDEDVDLSKGSHCMNDKRPTIFNGAQLLLNRAAVFFAAALFDESCGAVCGGAVAEDDAGSGLAEEADGGGSDAARAAGDERDFARE